MKRFKELLLIAGLSTLSLSGASALWRFPLERVSAQSSEDHVIYLNQGWSPEVREAYYHLSQGSTVMPYEAFELAHVNMANRPTLRAFEHTYETALGDGKLELASEILAAAEKRWGTARPLCLPSLILILSTEALRQSAIKEPSHADRPTDFTAGYGTSRLR